MVFIHSHIITLCQASISSKPLKDHQRATVSVKKAIIANRVLSPPTKYKKNQCHRAAHRRAKELATVNILKSYNYIIHHTRMPWMNDYV